MTRGGTIKPLSWSARELRSFLYAILAKTDAELALANELVEK